MAGVAQILSRIEDLNEPHCDMPPRVGCGQLAEYAYFDHATDKVIYRCKRHRIKVFDDEDDMLETIDTIEEAIAREVMDV
jgi:hypothetical protein